MIGYGDGFRGYSNKYNLWEEQSGKGRLCSTNLLDICPDFLSGVPAWPLIFRFCRTALPPAEHLSCCSGRFSFHRLEIQAAVPVEGNLLGTKPCLPALCHQVSAESAWASKSQGRAGRVFVSDSARWVCLSTCPVSV